MVLKAVNLLQIYRYFLPQNDTSLSHTISTELVTNT